MTSSKLLINEPPLQVLPSLAELIGLEEAIVLQQVHYWIVNAEIADDKRKFIDERYWVFNSYPEWQEKSFKFWSLSTIKRIFRKLEKSGLLISSQKRKDAWDRRKWYSVDYTVLNRLFEEVNLTSSRSSDRAIRADQKEPFYNGNTETPSENTSEGSEINELIEDMLQLWKKLFPDKPQPRVTTKQIRAHVRSRMKNADFLESWKQALEIASKSPTLQAESWFDFRFFVRNDENYLKMLDQWMAWKDERYRERNDTPAARIMKEVR